ncbi:hypothetical protein MMC34_008169 [Xylographa carneopallida]|nr:hypothetical protein [Xylographa carneopallida]
MNQPSFVIDHYHHLANGWMVGRRVRAPRRLSYGERRLWAKKVHLCLRIDWLQSQITTDPASEGDALGVYNEDFRPASERPCNTWRSLTSKRSHLRRWVIEKTPGAEAWLVPPPFGPRSRL